MEKRLSRRPTPPPPEEGPEEEGHDLRMGFFDHLTELRNRFLISFLSIAVTTSLGMLVAGPMLEFLMQPYIRLYPDEGRELVILGPTGGIVSFFRVALMIGGILAIPVITYQILRFVVPGLTKKERRYLFLSLPPITGLFLIGVFFAWLVLMPPAIRFLEGFQEDLFRSEWTADQYLAFVTAILFWMGVAFETPLVFFVLSLLGFVSPRTLVENWRFAVVGAAIAAALITPTVDPVNMFLVMFPLLALYLFSIFLVMIGRRISSVR